MGQLSIALAKKGALMPVNKAGREKLTGEILNK